MKKKEEIVPIVHKFDKSVGMNFLDHPIERRLKASKEAVTPWQFNYILRGGWQNMKEHYQVICSHNNNDLLVATISVFQILGLDHSVDFNWICNGLKSFDDSLIWSKEDLRYLADRMIVLSEDDVRIVHMESAKVIIALFFKGSSERKKQVLLSFIEKDSIEKYFSPLGLVWLCNGMSGYSSFYNTAKYFITEKMIISILKDISDIDTSEERMGIAYFIEKVFDTPCEKNGKYFFLQHKKIFLEWIQNADSETAYAYSRFINTLINTDIKLHREFVRQINWTRLQESMIQENKSNLYSWGKLYNRLLYSLPKKEYLSVGKMLENAIEKFCDSVSVLNIEDLTCFLCSVMHINSDYIHKTVEKLIPIYATYFKKDMSQAIYLFDFDFLGYVCGLNLLGGHRTTSVEKKSAKLIVSVIPEKEFAEVIMKCQPRDWHTVHPIMDLIGRYDREKAKRIIDIVDVSSLAERAKDSWRQSHEIIELCDILYIGNYNVAQRFIKSNLANIQTMYSSFIMMSPKCAIEAFDRGIKIDLLTEHWWSVSLYALQGLNKTDVEKTKEILLESVSQIIERINSITALDFDEKYFLKFLKLLKAIDSEIFGMIVLKLDITKIDNNWSKGAIRRGKEKQVKKRREQFYELIKQ